MNRISRKGIKCNWFTILIIVYLHKNLNLISDKKPVVQFIEYRPLVCLQYIDDNVVGMISKTPLWCQCYTTDYRMLISVLWLYLYLLFISAWNTLSQHVHILNFTKNLFFGGRGRTIHRNSGFFQHFSPNLLYTRAYYTRDLKVI